jgi:hypothetical protein
VACVAEQAAGVEMAAVFRTSSPSVAIKLGIGVCPGADEKQCGAEADGWTWLCWVRGTLYREEQKEEE